LLVVAVAAVKPRAVVALVATGLLFLENLLVVERRQNRRLLVLPEHRIP
jgi:hypothetical protein